MQSEGGRNLCHTGRCHLCVHFHPHVQWKKAKSTFGFLSNRKCLSFFFFFLSSSLYIEETNMLLHCLAPFMSRTYGRVFTLAKGYPSRHKWLCSGPFSPALTWRKGKQSQPWVHTFTDSLEKSGTLVLELEWDPVLRAEGNGIREAVAGPRDGHLS